MLSAAKNLFHKTNFIGEADENTPENLKDRLEAAKRIIEKYPDRRPIICVKDKYAEKGSPELTKKKFMVPLELTIGQFMYVLRKNMKLDPAKAIFLFVDGKIPTNTTFIRDLYDEYKNEDGFLYIVYSFENTFGG